MTEPVPLEYEVPSEPPAPKGALRIIFLIVFLDLMGFGIIIPLLPFYALQYDASALAVTVLFSIYSICQFIASPILGAVSDRYGRRPVLVISQLGSALGYVLLGVVTQLQWTNLILALGLIYLSRIIDGFSGGNISTAQAYVSDVTTPATRARGMGVLGAAFGIGFATGPAIGGLLGAYHVSWPAYAAAVFSFAAAIVSFARLPESRIHKPTEVEVWLHPSRFKLVLGRSAVLQLLLITFCSMSAFVMMESSIALFLNARFGYGPRQVGWFFAFAGVIIVIVQGGLIGRLTKLLGEWRLAIAGPLLVACGMICFITTGYLPLVPILLLGAAVNASGRSLQQPALSSLLSQFSGRGEQGIVFGLYHGLSSLARVVGPIIAGLAYERHHTAPFAVAGCIVVAVALWMALLRARTHQQAVVAAS